MRPIGGNGMSDLGRNFVLWAGLAFATNAMAQTKVVTYYYTDPQGSPLAIADAAGNIIDRFDYRPFGENAMGLVTDGPGYTGHVNDVDTEFIYMQQRYFDPSIKRFISTDPARLSAANLHNFTRYTYANNNPYLFIDENGKEASLYWRSPSSVTATIKYSTAGVSAGYSMVSVAKAAESRLSGLVNVDGTIVNVTTKVQFDAAQAPGSTLVVVVPDTAAVTQSGREETNRIGGDVVTLSAANPNPEAAAHEFGHVAGAGDQYKGGVDVNGKTLPADVPGPSNLMKDLQGNGANDQTLREMIQSGSNTNTCAPGAHAANQAC